MAGRRIATVFTDASFCHKTKAAGYAVWIKCDNETLRHSGAFKIDIPSAQNAETGALANGICIALSRLDLQKGDMIVAASDCKNAIAIIDGGLCPSKSTMKMRDRVQQDLSSRGVELKLNHVKAHQGKDAGPRHAVNEWCDGAAKVVMRGLRAKATQRTMENA